MYSKSNTPRRLAACCFLAPWLALAPTSLAQTAAKPPASSASSTQDEAVKLKEFVVTDSEDVGYSTPNAIGVGRFPTALIDTPQTINVLNRQFMDDFQAAELFDVLKYVAAVSIESNVGDSVQVRGYTVRDQYTDGVVDNQNQSQMGAEPFQFERIEVMKGPSALVYGSTAIGGVTNRVRKTPLWKPKGEIGLTFGNHDQLKTDFDYTTPLSKQVSTRMVATYRTEGIVNNVAARFAYARRYNINPMLTWRLTPTTQLRVVGEILHEKSFKHWGENGMFQPFTPVKGYTIVPFGLTRAQGGFTTWGLLPRDFTFSEQQAHVRNDKQAGSVYFEMQPTPEFMVRLFGTASFWDHFVEDVIPVGMAANNTEMTRLWRTIGNDDFYLTGGIDSSYRLKLPGQDHRFLFVSQYTTRRLWQEIVQDTANPIPNLSLFNPVYAPYTPKTPRRTNYQFTNAGNHNFAAQDHLRLFNEMFQVVGGARFDKFNTRTDNVLTSGAPGRTNFGDAWTYKYGAIFKPTKAWSMFYNHSETYAPNFGSQPDGSLFEPQLGTIEEGGFKLNILEGRIAGTVSMYDLQLQNLLTADPDPVRAAQGWRIQIAKQKTQGVEADIFVTVTRNWSFNIGGAKMEVSLPSGLYPRGSPRSTANFNTRYRFSGEGPLGFLKGLAVGGGIMHKGPAPVDAINSYYLPKYTVGDVFANYSWGKYRFALNVNNVTDKWYLARAVSKEQVFQGSDRIIKFRVTRTF